MTQKVLRDKRNRITRARFEKYDFQLISGDSPYRVLRDAKTQIAVHLEGNSTWYHTKNPAISYPTATDAIRAAIKIDNNEQV